MAFTRSKHRGTADSGDTAVLAKVPADGLAAELAAAAPKQWWNRWTLCLAAVLLLGGGVMAGVQIQQRWGTSATSGRGMTLPGGAQGGSGFSGGGQGQGQQAAGQQQGAGQQTAETEPSGATTEGTVKLVNGTTVYIVTADGQTITVKTSGDTTVTKAAEGALSDLAEGDTVSVEGVTGDDNSVTATAITEK